MILGKLPQGLYFIGDEGFSCTNNLLTPWSGVGIGVPKGSFNFNLSIRRQVIERAFGILTRRWGIFWRDVVCGHPKWALIATVCAKLHNICLDANEIIAVRHHKDWQEHDTDDVFLNTIHDEDPNVPVTAHGLGHGSKRKRMTEQLDLMGVRRPMYASRNSKA